ncbi:MAG: hypothetical protein U0805_02780 [Pirellulales bacterium]
MEARITRVVSLLPLFVGLGVALAPHAHAAGYKTTNFVVSAPTPDLAKAIGDQAETFRHDLAIAWLGQELPQWSKPCPINAQVAPNLGAGGATSFVFDRGEVYGWKMNIQGSRERILDSVLPHEVTHTIFASYFRQPLPRWADEGACTTVEHRSEIAKQEANLIKYLQTGRGIPFAQMFAMKEYPSDVMPLYAQGHSLSEWLIESRGRKEFLSFLADGMRDENWPRAVRDHYGYNNLVDLQNNWNTWVKQGRPQLGPATGVQIASAARNAAPSVNAVASNTAVRFQSPDPYVTPASAAAPITPLPAPAAATATQRSKQIAVAQPGESIYAVAANRAEQELASPVRPINATAANSASVYDASRGTATLRR